MINERDCHCDRCLAKYPPQKAIRYCYLCQTQIVSHDKWVFDLFVIQDRPRKVASIIRHRHCDARESYMIPDHYERQFGRPTP